MAIKKWLYLHGHDAKANKPDGGTTDGVHHPKQHQTESKEQHDANPEPELQHETRHTSPIRLDINAVWLHVCPLILSRKSGSVQNIADLLHL